eukprot:3935404-Rhodomonas_salina.2
MVIPGSPPTGVAKKGGIGMSYVFLLDFDHNHDSKISVEEWNEGFGNEKEDEQLDQQEEEELMEVVT